MTYGSNSVANMHLPGVILELFVKDINLGLKRILFELNVEELEVFLNQLTQLQSVLYISIYIYICIYIYIA